MKCFAILVCLVIAGCATPDLETTRPVKVDMAEIDRIISIFTETIENDPNYAGAYYNRAIAYFYLNDYEKSWRDLYVTESFGLEFSPKFIRKLKKASKK